MSFLRFLMLLALTTWLGGLVFFLIVASIAFTALPSAHLAGIVVRNCLLALHWMGLIAGAIFLVCSFIYDRALEGRFRPLRASHVSVILMLLVTAISQFRIIPRMETLRDSAAEIALLSPSNPIRLEFEHLHARSVRMEGAVLLLAVLVLYLTARRFGSLTA